MTHQAPSVLTPPIPEVAACLDDVTAVRHDLHAHPELGFQEVRTAAVAAAKLREYGCDEVYEGIGRTGVVGVIRGRPGRHGVAIRADMDALPLTETTGHAWASQTPGRMHACGHDGHVAWALAAARALAATRRFAGTAVILIQPGEEGYAGAREMIRDGLFERVPVDEIYGAHGSIDVPLGSYGFSLGPVTAAADKFTITVKGVGGHGSRPHRCIDPVVIAAEVIGAVQTIVSRSVDPMRPAAITIGSIHGGDPDGVSVIPEKVVMAGTTRCQMPEDRDTIERRLGEICRGLSLTTGADITLDYIRMYPPLINRDPYVSAARDAAVSFAGADHAVVTEASMGAEDFSFFLEEKPGAFFWVGTGDDEHRCGAHHPGFDFNDKAIGGAASIFVKLVEARLAALEAAESADGK